MGGDAQAASGRWVDSWEELREVRAAMVAHGGVWKPRGCMWPLRPVHEGEKGAAPPGRGGRREAGAPPGEGDQNHAPGSGAFLRLQQSLDRTGRPWAASGGRVGAGEGETCLQPLLDPNSVPEAEAIPRALGASRTPGSLCAVCATLGWCL